jgi:hypothetical protein
LCRLDQSEVGPIRRPHGGDIAGIGNHHPLSKNASTSEMMHRV